MSNWCCAIAVLKLKHRVRGSVCLGECVCVCLVWVHSWLVGHNFSCFAPCTEESATKCLFAFLQLVLHVSGLHMIDLLWITLIRYGSETTRGPE